MDHKPLLKIFSDRSLDEISNNRLQNLKEKTLRYRFRIVHIPGLRHKAADAVSRHPTGPTNPDRLHLSDDIAAICNNEIPLPMSIMGQSFLAGIRCHETRQEPCSQPLDTQLAAAAASTLRAMAVTWDRVKLETTSDTTLSQLVTIIESGFPDFRHELPHQLQEYYQFREHL